MIHADPGAPPDDCRAFVRPRRNAGIEEQPHLTQFEVDNSYRHGRQGS